MNEDLNHDAFERWINVRQAITYSRQLLILSTNSEIVGESVPMLCDITQNAIKSIAATHTSIIYVGNFADQIPECFDEKISVNQLQRQLGKQYNALILDCRDGWQPNALYAASGLVRASGLLVLLTPKIVQWQHYYAQHSQIRFSYGDKHASSSFTKYLYITLCSDENVAWHSSESSELPIIEDLTTTPQHTISNPFMLSDEQQHIATTIKHDWQRRTSSLNFISGGRGRGKTTLLAFLCEQSLRCTSERFRKIAICAPTMLQRNIIKQYMDNEVRNQTKLVSIAPDQFEQLDSDTLLFIDEAASISPSLLSSLCERVKHAVISATTEGYEGSGKGLIYRWLPQIEYQLMQHRLTQPFRWGCDDVLEALVQRLFEPNLAKSSDVDNTQLNLHLFHKTSLLSHPTLLRACIALLQQAHYQSTPTDILRMLDADDQQIWGFTYKAEPLNANSLLGVICTISEGGSEIFHESNLCDDIALGKRRVQGHMGLQAIASGLHNSDVLQYKTCRIHRIAVRPEQQNAGIGSQMLSALLKHQPSMDVDGFSTAFGLTERLNKFWQKNNYELVKLGHRKDTSSGTVTGHYLHKHSKLFHTIYAQSLAHLKLDLNYMLDFRPELINVLPASIIYELTSATNPPCLYELAIEKLRFFSQGKLSYAMAAPAVYFASMRTSNHGLLSILKCLHKPHHSKEAKQAYETLIIKHILVWLEQKPSNDSQQ